jgi:serine/threonine-protein kinase
MALLEPGTEIGGYRIDGILGSGGVGVVYEATEIAMERVVALKVLQATAGADEATRERFRREALRQAAFDHPNVVPIYDAVDAEGTLLIAMRLVRGSTLKDLIRAGEVDPERAIRILLPVADALDAAHEEGMVHRDVKPQNVLVADGGHAYLADLGLMRQTGESRLTEAGQYVGSIDYMAPEQLNQDPATWLTDVYSFTAVLYEALAGSVPYPRPVEAAIFYAHIAEPPPSVMARRPELPAEVDAVIARGMAKAPDDRYQTTVEVVEAAAAALGIPV